VQKRLKGVPDLPFPPIVAGLYGVVSGFLVYSTPQWLFEHAVDMSGIAQFVPAATPPLGEKARLMAAGASVFAVALALWPVLAIAQRIVRKMRKKPEVHVRARGIVIADSIDNSVVSHLTVPQEVSLPGASRAPIFADNELGAPLMSDEALVAGGELVLDAPLDAPLEAPSLLVKPGEAAPSLDDVMPVPHAFDAGPDSSFAPAQPAYAEWTPTPPIVQPEIAAEADMPAPALSGSQFQISIPIAPQDASEPSPFAVPDLPPVAEVAETPLIEEAQEPAFTPHFPAVQEEPVASPYQTLASAEDESEAYAAWEASLPPRSKPAAYIEPKEESLSEPVTSAPIQPDVFANPMQVAFPQTALAEVEAAPVAHAGFGGDDRGVVSDPMKISLFPSAAPTPLPVSAEPAPAPLPTAFEPPAAAPVAMAAPEPVYAPAAAAPDNSVNGLMARLNSAMGARQKPAAEAAPSLAGMKVSFGAGRPAF
jgi:hypothetical protein